jgi:hypothetical protein
LQDAVTSIRDDVSVDLGAVDHSRRIHEATREEVRSLTNLVMAMERQIMRLQTDVRALKGEP